MRDASRQALLLLLVAGLAVGILHLARRGDSSYSLVDLLTGKPRPTYAPETYTLPQTSPVALSDVRLLDQLNAEFTRLTAAVVPCVVSIDTREAVTVRGLFPGQRDRRAYLPADGGSGVIVTPEGHILTNLHVVRNKDAIQVTRVDADGGREFFPADLVGAYAPYDIAVLKIRSARSDFPALKMGDSDAVKPGQIVFAVGSPYRLSESVTQGIISAIDRQISDTGPSFFQTSAPINKGNSGGPLVNHLGEVIGINSAVLGRTPQGQTAQNIGFAITSNQAWQAFRAITGRGRQVAGYLGVAVRDITPIMAEAIGLSEARGLLVEGLLPDGPAVRAGLRLYDVILEADGEPVESREAFLERVRYAPPGRELRLAIWRQREGRLSLVAVVGDSSQLPAQEAAANSGASATSRDEAVRWLRRVGLSVGPADDRAGVVVEAVSPGSLAEGKVATGEHVVEVNGLPVSSPASFHRALLESKGSLPVDLQVVGERERRRVLLGE